MSTSRTMRIVWIVVTTAIIVGLATLVVVLGHRVWALSSMVEQMSHDVGAPLCECRPCREIPISTLDRLSGGDTVSSLIAEIDTTREEQARLRAAVQRAVQIHANVR